MIISDFWMRPSRKGSQPYGRHSPPAFLKGIFGAQAIADELGLELRKTFYLLGRGYLPATKCGATWTSTRSRLRRFFDGGERE